MPTNPWLALDVTTSPVERARELRRAWDHYVAGGQVTARIPIADSWQRSRRVGIDPSGSRAPTMLTDRRDVAARWGEHPLATAAAVIHESLGAVADESEHLIVVSDADGVLLWIEGRARLRSAAADAMNFVEGAVWSEVGAGTNAIGTALAADHPVQVHAAEHLVEVVHGWTCSAAPIHDPDSGCLLGIIDLTGRMATAHPHSFAVALATALAVEADLRASLQERDARLRARVLPTASAGREALALVSRSGRVIADDPAGFVRAERLDVPPGGGELVLPSGRRAAAEPIDREEAFIIRPLPEVSGTGGPLPRSAMASVDAVDRRPVSIELRRIEEEHAALRRVATLVAGQTAPEAIFAAVAAEVARLLDADRGVVCRYEPDESMTVMAYWSDRGPDLLVGTRVGLQGDSVAGAIRRSGGPTRLDSYEGLSGPVIDVTHTLGAPPRSTVGAPIVVAGRVWGAVLASSTKPQPLPDDAMSRLTRFAELVSTAISNAVGRAELSASRARIVAASDEARRRIERDLHDGAQQHLVALALELREAEAKVPEEFDDLRSALSRTARGLATAVDELHEISLGIHPAILARGGLGPALKGLARRAAVPVELEVRLGARLPEPVEVAAYYVVSEGITNVVKHARASVVRVVAETHGESLQLTIEDDGAGGADPTRGSGLTGLRDRIDALGGTLRIDSPVGAGTSLLVELPVTPSGG